MGTYTTLEGEIIQSIYMYMYLGRNAAGGGNLV